MKEIQLTQGKVAIVDDSDFDSVNKHTWHAAKSGRRIYAQHSYRRSDGEWATRRLHQFLIPSAEDVDHKDGDGLNNQRNNLRVYTRSQNMRAFQRKRAGTSSVFRGVSWYSQTRKWQASIRMNKKTTHLGYFQKEVDAAFAYDTAAMRSFGDFGALNFP